MSDINEVRGRLERDAEDFTERGLAIPTANDIRALLDAHARLQRLETALAGDLERLIVLRNRLHQMACRIGQEWEDEAGELQREVQAMIDAAKAVQP